MLVQPPPHVKLLRLVTHGLCQAESMGGDVVNDSDERSVCLQHRFSWKSCIALNPRPKDVFTRLFANIYSFPICLFRFIFLRSAFSRDVDPCVLVPVTETTCPALLAITCSPLDPVYVLTPSINYAVRRHHIDSSHSLIPGALVSNNPCVCCDSGFDQPGLNILAFPYAPRLNGRNDFVAYLCKKFWLARGRGMG